MKENEETKRHYKFTFDEIKKLLNLDGDFAAFGTKDDRGKESSELKIITIESTDKK